MQKKMMRMLLAMVVGCSISTVNSYAISKKEERTIVAAAKDAIMQSCDPQKRKSIFEMKVTPFLKKKRGVFVTLYKNGKLRGCIGHLRSDVPLYTLIPRIAKKSAFEDGRFLPVTCDELPDISVTVSVLTNPRPIKSYKEIELGKHGIILQQGYKSAVYLPKVPIEQKWNLATTLKELSIKAGLAADAWKDPQTTFKVFESVDVL